jgi:hypothetical protein
VGVCVFLLTCLENESYTGCAEEWYGKVSSLFIGGLSG